ncbi:hypothetical protein BdWA1_001492 [Babesia duncani]|uniref:Uncharacterized protein n=1 Tax=Babesia duncani TaxID=323732 RepID=A0AAD9UR07_9APIC|nr:hypothetical protein BdWA1_001492 [Babesia duncani]
MQEFIEREDAIMDESVFPHIKKVISYMYNYDNVEDKSGDSPFSDYYSQDSCDEYAKELNRGVLNTLVDRYVGYAWLCEVCARWIVELQETEEEQTARKNTGTSNIYNVIYDALMAFLKSNYDTEKMRMYMEDKHDHEKWNPPELYWNLMKSPLVASHMMDIYRDKPKDPFLSSWYQDYIKYTSSMKAEQSEINTEGLSRITSNFSVFTLRISEEIRKFLLKVKDDS